MKKIFFWISCCIFIISCGIFDDNENQSSITKLYVTLQQTDEVAIYNTPDLTLLKIIDIDFTGDNVTDTPHFIILDEENGYWYVTTMQSGWVGQYSLITDELIDTVDVGDYPALLAINPDDEKLYVSRMMMYADTYVINEIDYSGNNLSDRDIPLDSPILHGICIDFVKANIFTVSNTADWLYRVDINGAGDYLSVSMDPSNNNPEYPNKKFQPIQCIALNDSLIAITCSAAGEAVKGQIQIWNGNDLTFMSSYEFDFGSRPWHLIKSPINEEVFVVLGGTTGNGGVASLIYGEGDDGVIIFEQKWRTPTNDYNMLHGIAVDALGKYLYVSGRGDDKLYQFNADTGDELDSTPLGGTGAIIAPAGIAIMQQSCINCE